MPRIFISYRRSDNPYVPHFLRDRLAEAFGPDAVFMDIDSIPFGVDFVEYLDEQVGRCDILLAMIGDRWLDASFADGPKAGQRRLDDPADFVRIEIASALARKIPVIPVLMDSATVPGEAHLPDDLKPLARRNAAEVRPGRDLQAHIDRLVRGIEQLASRASGRTGTPDQPTPRREPPPLLSFPLTAEQAQEYQRRWAEHLGIKVEFVNSIAMKFAFIPPGAFLMGSPDGEESRGSDEKLHKVTLTKGFYLGVTPITQAQWQSVTGSNPSHFLDAARPVERVSWEDCQRFLEQLSRMEGKWYALPTEAQWEYACRAGTTTAYCSGDGAEALKLVGWCYYDVKWGSVKESKPVGSFPPNAWGLYDMHGNVWEWCADWYGDYPRGEIQDYKGPQNSQSRVLRGGSWVNSPRYCRSASRISLEPGERGGGYCGVRLAFRLD